MRYKRLKLSAVLLLGLGLTGLQAQESVNATGGNASGSGGSASYSVGQVVYTTNTGTTGSVAQGVQQPYEISIVSGIEETNSIILKCSAYPNPTTDFLTLNVENYDNENLSYQLFDISGKLIENKKLTSNEITISMANLVSSMYFLKVVQTKHASSQQEIKTFKIIKTQ
ncbi:MAG: T9SS type A sorting domain-containing protein [Prolixibacteraceae bacterium]|jgi:hypothetical protein|nr:T9SS type A sorting domain-containing protein [Prolixibacteraceae bacterium]